MENLGSKDLPTVFIIPPFRIRRIVPKVGIALFAGLAFFIPLKMGGVRTAAAFAENPGMFTAVFIVSFLPAYGFATTQFPRQT